MKIDGTTWGAAMALAAALCPAAAGAEPGRDGLLEEVVVVGVTPGAGSHRRPEQVARHVQVVDTAELERSLGGDIASFMTRNLASISGNDAQNNPLQPDLQFRGYTASPLLGLPQGLAVYQNGARLNEPLGDVVNWDLLPQSAIHRVSLIGGADPLYGPNSLGGALAIEMKDGFTFEGHQAGFSAGSHGRRQGALQSGGNDGRFGYYVNVDRFDEDGWRDLSPSRADNVYLALSWRGERSFLDLTAHHADTSLTGNGTAPVGLLERDREAIFTAPDITANDMMLTAVQGGHDFRDNLRFTGSVFHRRNEARSLNGDASDFTPCELGNGPRLLEGLEADDLEELGLELSDVCDGARHADVEALQGFLNGFPGEGLQIEDLTASLSGSGMLTGAAINNRSTRDQESRGFDVALELDGNWFGQAHQLVMGVRRYHGDSRFRAAVELAGLDPVTRSTEGLGVGTFVDAEATAVATSTESWSIYVHDTIAVTETLTLTLGGRYDDTNVTIRDRSGRRPEVEGDHDFQRFNPAAGATWQATDQINLFASYAESSRAPTPIELTCNESVFEDARRRARERGDVPAAVDLECRLPNAFVADPPLDLVVARARELGARGTLGDMRWHVGLFDQINGDDIVFQTTGRATGLFGSIDRTRRRGAEVALTGDWHSVAWRLAYTYLRATFEDRFAASSPSHPLADAEGRIFVASGDRIPGIAPEQWKAGADWQVTAKLAIGGDVVHFAGSHLRGDEANHLPRLDGYTLVHLRARYRLNDRLSAFVRLDNALDAEYENFGMIAENPTEVIGDLKDSRPIFLAPGAPRGAWLGLRIRL